jgi:hypothetical protein
MQINHRVRVQNQMWRHDPDTGFLRCTAVILQAGCMDYTEAELGGARTGKQRVRIMVPADAIVEPASVTSLEGMPITCGHVWQDTSSVELSCGAVAGTPRIVGTDLVADLLVTDSEVARKIMLPKEDIESLQEISSAFDAQVIWEPGQDEFGEYDGRFERIRYNHVAILQPGQARGGSSVRIINKEAQAMEITRVKLPSGRTVRVINEDAPILEEDAAASEAKTKNAIDPAKAAELIAELSDVKGQRDALDARVQEISGQLQSLKDQLDAAMSDEKIAEAATEMVNEQKVAAEVMNAHGVTADVSKLRGHALRVAIVNSVAAARGKPQLPADANEHYVRGMFTGLTESQVTPPAGHKLAAVTNAATTAAPDMNDPAARRKRLGYAS